MRRVGASSTRGRRRHRRDSRVPPARRAGASRRHWWHRLLHGRTARLVRGGTLSGVLHRVGESARHQPRQRRGSALAYSYYAYPFTTPTRRTRSTPTPSRGMHGRAPAEDTVRQVAPGDGLAVSQHAGSRDYRSDRDDEDRPCITSADRSDLRVDAVGVRRLSGSTEAEAALARPAPRPTGTGPLRHRLAGDSSRCCSRPRARLRGPWSAASGTGRRAGIHSDDHLIGQRRRPGAITRCRRSSSSAWSEIMQFCLSRNSCRTLPCQ